MLRYGITDSAGFGKDFAARRSGLVAQTRRLMQAEVDYIQLREKDLGTGELFSLAEELSCLLRDERSRTKLLVNSRCDVAVAAGVHGVHLTSHMDELTPEGVREIFTKANTMVTPQVSVSCHSLEDVARASAADLILFGPVFEKRVRGEHVLEGAGLDALHAACNAAGKIPVFALGGITDANARSCMDAGAAGVAGIRLFQ